jgi:ubiquinone/menaquinone biosynthesis C-methylase UbiE
VGLDARGIRNRLVFMAMERSNPMMSSVLDLTTILLRPQGDPVRLYHRLAPYYDRLHRHWLRIGGAACVAAVQGALAAELRPGLRVLDAGCGTGVLGGWIVEQEPLTRLTLLDAAPAMLERAAQRTHARTVHGNLTALPFPDAAFDAVTCMWALETVDDPLHAVAELERVLVPGGLLCCCFCNQPSGWWTRLLSVPVRWTITNLFAGRFLTADLVDSRGGGRPRLLTFHGGLSAFICCRKPASDG